MDTPLFKELLDQNVITNDEYTKLSAHKNKPISVYQDLTSLLYIGILLFTAGVSVLVYKHIDTIGHRIVVIFIAAASLLCYIYSFRNAAGYATTKVESKGTIYDYILLLGCLLLLTLIAYVQYEYTLFGSHWGMAAFVPMVIMFISAYYFDHLGVLVLAISNLAAWIGLSIQPWRVSYSNDQMIFAGIALGIFLLGLSYFSVRKELKAHFAFTYQNFGIHFLLSSLLAGLFTYYDVIYLFFILIVAVCYLLFRNAMQRKSFYLLVVSFGYFYIAVSYCIVHISEKLSISVGIIYLLSLYFILSGIALIWLLIHFNKFIKQHDTI